ncbi:MAG: SsrA-binding protein SmpB [Saprospiraceae bacterium]|nr:SsrA-binding protein SmpB [Saprospiraceae bacterium]
MTQAPKQIINRKAKFEYHFIQGYDAGIMLQGTEVKSLRLGEANLNDAYCMFINDELFIKSLYIAEYDKGNINNHETRRDRKLLLRKSELRKIQKKSQEKGYTIIPYRIFFSERGLVKVEIQLVQGKKAYDKRHSIKEKDVRRELDRINKFS